MGARKQSKVNVKYRTKYRVTKWPEYDESLRLRGDVTVWFDVDVVEAWNAVPSAVPGGRVSTRTWLSSPR